MKGNCKSPKSRVAVIVPVYNDGATLGLTLRAIEPDIIRFGWDFIVVDDVSTDDSAKIAKEYRTQVIRLEQNKGVAAARNAGANATEADILVFVDADIKPQPETIFAMVNVLQNRPEIHAVGAYPLPGDLSPQWSSHFVGLRSSWGYHWNDNEEERFFSSVQSECGAIRKNVFEKCGGFTERHSGVGMEEFYLGHVMETKGFKNILLRSASYQHYYKSLTKRCFTLIERTSRWVPLFLSRKKFETHGAVGSQDAAFSCVLTFIALTALSAGIFIRWGITIAGLTLLVQIIFEWTFLNFAYKVYGWRMVFYSLPALQVMHLFIGLGFICGLKKYFLGVFYSSSKKTIF